MSNTYRKVDPHDEAQLREDPDCPILNNWIENQMRDRKRYGKPASWYKKMNRRLRRAKEKEALREDRLVPIFKKTDEWDWN